ncbi:STM3941 family protein [Sphingomonas sp.]|uniref:STM3941 family protein n=1 Tax=Sphingomonas sp. TaxID=28214 RepID=UPI001ED0AFD3|nr:STM3941 family protein [Sphingomonas sp.]MBX3594947.1 hypothetical protein [Sphingomonas sp.]
MTDRFVARVSRADMGVLLAVVAGVAALGGWLALDRVEGSQGGVADPATWLHAMGWLILLCAGAGLAVIVRQMLRTGPVVEVDARGIRWSRWSDEVIPWAAITRIEPQVMGRQLFLCLWLDQPDRYPCRSLLGRLAWANRRMGFGDIALNMQGLDRSFDDLLAAVEPHWLQRVGTGSAPE